MITLAAIAAATGLGGITTLVAWSIQDNLETLGITGLTGLAGLCMAATMGAMIWIWAVWEMVEEEYRTLPRDEAQNTETKRGGKR